MTVSAWIMMLSTMLIVTSFTLFFFLRMLRTPAHSSQAVISPAEGMGSRESVAGSPRTDEPGPLP